MTRDEIITVNRERLEQWFAGLSDSGALALVLIGCTQGEQAGKTVLFTLEDLPDRSLFDLLITTARAVHTRRYRR